MCSVQQPRKVCIAVCRVRTQRSLLGVGVKEGSCEAVTAAMALHLATEKVDNPGVVE